MYLTSKRHWRGHKKKEEKKDRAYAAPTLGPTNHHLEKLRKTK